MESSRVRVLVVIPVYNNEHTVAGIVREVSAMGLPLLVVDDGSTDGSLSVLGGLPVHRIRFPTNRGKGRAIRCALSWAGGHGFTHIITLDADGQHAAQDIPRFLEKIQESPDTIIIGKRRFGPGIPGGSRFGRRWSNMWIRIASGVTTPDSQSGFRAYPVARLAPLRFVGSRYEFEVEVLVRAAWAGVKLDWVDVSVRYFSEGQRISHFRPFWDNLRISLIYSLLVARRLFPWSPRRFFCESKERPVPRHSGHPPGAGRPGVPGNPQAGQGLETPSYGNRAGYNIFRWVIKKFGVFPAYGILGPVIAYYVLFRPSAFRAAAPYLERRFAWNGWLKKIWLTARYYYSFGLCLIDQAATSILGREGLKIVFPDADQLRELSEERRGLVLVVSHVGVWHSAIQTLDYLKRSVYLNWRREMHSQWMGLGDFQDSAVDVHIISPDGFLGGIPEMSLALAHGHIVAVMGDRGYGSATGQRVEFLGKKAYFPILPYHLAFSTRSDLVVFLTSRLGPRRILLRAAIKKMTEDLLKLGKARACSVLLSWYIGVLEKHVNDHPFMWYNFMDIWKL